MITSTEARAELTRTERQLTAERAHLVTLEAALRVVTENEAKLAALAESRPLDYYEQHQRNELAEARTMIELGVRQRDGLAFDFLAPLTDKPGLLRTQQTVAALETRIAEMRRAIDRWPSDTAVRPFRYVGPPQTTMIEAGRWAKPGEVVMLSEGQAESFGDRFEAVEEETATVTS